MKYSRNNFAVKILEDEKGLMKKYIVLVHDSPMDLVDQFLAHQMTVELYKERLIKQYDEIQDLKLEMKDMSVRNET